MRQGPYFCFFLIVMMSFSAQARAEAVGSASYAGRIDTAIKSAIERGDIPGAVVLLGKGDAVIYRKAYGHRALRPKALPMTVDTIFDMASLTKPVATATSVMILADRGLIDLHQPVAKYLPEFGQNGKEGITIEQLLLHRGGLIPDNPLSDYADGPWQSMLNIFALRPQWRPGTVYKYTNVGYMVLGELVRRVDGRAVNLFARDETFGPLGMYDSTFNPPAAWKERCAATARRDGRWMVGEVHDPRAFALGGVAGHAGLFSTAKDLSRYCRMILHGGELEGVRILSESMVRRMTEKHCLPDGTGCRSYLFTFGGESYAPRGGRFERGATFGHTGFTGTMFWIDLVHEVYVILLTNRVHPDNQGRTSQVRNEVSTTAAEWLLGPR